MTDTDNNDLRGYSAILIKSNLRRKIRSFCHRSVEKRSFDIKNAFIRNEERYIPVLKEMMLIYRKVYVRNHILEIETLAIAYCTTEYHVGDQKLIDLLIEIEDSKKTR